MTAEPRVGLDDVDVDDADRVDRALAMLAAERSADDLVAEAQAEHGDLGVDRAQGEVGGERERGVAVDLGGAPLAPGADDAPELVEPRQRGGE